MINRVVITGRLTKDPELRYTPNGVAVANFTVAVGRSYSNGNGERETDFINCVVWRGQAENLANFQKKGALIGVDGSLQTRTYDGNDGKRVWVTEVMADSVQYLEKKSEQGQGQNQNQNYQGSNNGGGYQQQGGQGNYQQGGGQRNNQAGNQGNYNNRNQGNYQPSHRAQGPQGGYQQGGNNGQGYQQGNGGYNQGQKQGRPQNQQQGQQGQPGFNDPFANDSRPIDISDDDLPF